MEKLIKWEINQVPKDTEEKNKALLAFLSPEEVNKAKQFHMSFPQYCETPMVNLPNLADYLGLKNIYLKDEAYRFGLNAFKVLGGSFAMAKYLAEKLDKDISELPYDVLISDEVRDQLGEITFVTATDGNHGRGVAWTAKKLKQKAIVYMPIGSAQIRYDNIAAEDAEVSITDLNYDDCVRLSDQYVKSHENSVVVQDTAWEGYEKIPAWIMQGYATMAIEAIEQLQKSGVDMPSHIFIQAGVGSLAGAVQGVFAARFGKNAPIVTVVEASLADCLYKSALRRDGSYTTVGGDMQTIMAGLACGEPNIIGWDILKNHAAAFVSAEDHVAANGMRILASPVGNDPRVVSGESGAATIGALYEIMTNDDHKELRDALNLTKESTVLLFSTEGDTDPGMYRDVVWEGRNSKI